MKQERPLLGSEAGAQPLLPLPFAEHVAVIKASAAVDAFAKLRAGQIIGSGHTPESDLERSIGHIAGQARYRLSALYDVVGRDRMNLPPGRRSECLKYIESAAAILIALWERCQVEVPEE